MEFDPYPRTTGPQIQTLEERYELIRQNLNLISVYAMQIQKQLEEIGANIKDTAKANKRNADLLSKWSGEMRTNELSVLRMSLEMDRWIENNKVA